MAFTGLKQWAVSRSLKVSLVYSIGAYQASFCFTIRVQVDWHFCSLHISSIYSPSFFSLCSWVIQSSNFSKLHIKKVSNSAFSVSSREQSSNAVKFKAEIPNQASRSTTEVYDSFISGGCNWNSGHAIIMASENKTNWKKYFSCFTQTLLIKLSHLQYLSEGKFENKL